MVCIRFTINLNMVFCENCHFHKQNDTTMSSAHSTEIVTKVQYNNGIYKAIKSSLSLQRSHFSLGFGFSEIGTIKYYWNLLFWLRSLTPPASMALAWCVPFIPPLHLPVLDSVCSSYAYMSVNLNHRIIFARRKPRARRSKNMLTLCLWKEIFLILVET